jgi:hypothetical protein
MGLRRKGPISVVGRQVVELADTRDLKGPRLVSVTVLCFPFLSVSRRSVGVLKQQLSV